MRDLDLLRGTSFLADDDFAFLASAAAELQDTLAKRQIFRTETEMEVSVLNDIKHPTSASKYWQSVREQGVMLDSLIMLGFDYRRNETAVKRHQRKIEAALDDLDREEARIDLDECHYKRANMESVAHDRIREIRMWSAKKAELDDGSFDTRDVNSHQLISYAQRFILQASNAPVDMPVAEANNLKGQLLSTVRHLHERGLLEDAIASLPQALVARVLGDALNHLMPATALAAAPG